MSANSWFTNGAGAFLGDEAGVFLGLGFGDILGEGPGLGTGRVGETWSFGDCPGEIGYLGGRTGRGTDWE